MAVTAPQYTIRLDGVERLNKALGKYGKEVEAKARQITGSVAYLIMTQAKINSPYKHGRLRSSIDWEWKGRLTAEIGTNVEYANFQEFGFQGNVNVRAHSRKVKKIFGRTLPTPVMQDVRSHTRSLNYKGKRYVGNAFDKYRPRYIKRMEDMLKTLDLT
jgi:HK97 gp10 family phage protein